MKTWDVGLSDISVSFHIIGWCIFWRLLIGGDPYLVSRQRCRDDCVNVKLFVKLFVTAELGSGEERCREWGRSHPGYEPRPRGQSPSQFIITSDSSASQSPCQAAPGKDVVFMHRLLCFLPIVSLFWRNSILCFTMASNNENPSANDKALLIWMNQWDLLNLR